MDRSLVESLRAQINLLELAQEQVVLRKVGRNWSGLCPFHSERSPSFSVSEEKQVFHCHGCQAGGDVFKFYQLIHSVDFTTSVFELAERVQFKDPQLQKVLRSHEGFQPKFATSYRLNRFASLFYFKNSTPFVPILSDSRGVSQETLRKYYLGYAPASGFALFETLKNAQAPLDLAQELGLLNQSRDFFRHKLTIPFTDTRGRILGFTARKVDGDGPKYINSMESFLFKKSEIVLGLFQAAKAIRETKTVFIVEGAFDVLALWDLGFSNVVAPCGTAWTVEQIRLLAPMAEKFVLFFDGDRAGQKAAERALELALQVGIRVYGVTPPPGLDPSDWRQKNPESMKEALNAVLKGETQPFLQLWFYKMAAVANADPVLAPKVLERVKKILTSLKTQEEKQWWQKQIRESFGVSLDLNVSQKARPSEQFHLKYDNHPKVDPGVSYDALEKKVFLALYFQVLKKEDYLDVQVHLPKGYDLSCLWTHPAFKKWATPDENQVVRILGQSREFGFEPSLQNLWIEAEFGHAPDPKEAMICLGRLVGRAWARFSHVLKLALGSATQADEPRLLEEYLDVQRQIKELDKFYESFQHE